MNSATRGVVVEAFGAVLVGALDGPKARLMLSLALGAGWDVTDLGEAAERLWS